jgi:hypothetical protein
MRSRSVSPNPFHEGEGKFEGNIIDASELKDAFHEFLDNSGMGKPSGPGSYGVSALFRAAFLAQMG